MLLATFTISSCDGLSVEKSISTADFQLVDQDSNNVSFPDSFRGKVMLVGYVYTHCPDICPVITYNMRDIQRELPDESDFMLISLSFDPERDTPEILSEYASNYKLDQSNWRMLTGETAVVDQALELMDIRTLKTPTQFTEDNKPQYFIDHTDEVTLIDKKGNIRNTYPGSDMDNDKIVKDIHTLLTEKG